MAIYASRTGEKLTNESFFRNKKIKMFTVSEVEDEDDDDSIKESRKLDEENDEVNWSPQELARPYSVSKTIETVFQQTDDHAKPHILSQKSSENKDHKHSDALLPDSFSAEVHPEMDQKEPSITMTAKSKAKETVCMREEKSTMLVDQGQDDSRHGFKEEAKDSPTNSSNELDYSLQSGPFDHLTLDTQRIFDQPMFQTPVPTRTANNYERSNSGSYSNRSPASTLRLDIFDAGHSTIAAGVVCFDVKPVEFEVIEKQKEEWCIYKIPVCHAVLPSIMSKDENFFFLQANFKQKNRPEGPAKDISRVIIDSPARRPSPTGGSETSHKGGQRGRCETHGELQTENRSGEGSNSRLAKASFNKRKREPTPIPSNLKFKSQSSNQTPVTASIIASPHASLSKKTRNVASQTEGYSKVDNKKEKVSQCRNEKELDAEVSNVKIDMTSSLEHRRGALNHLTFKLDIGGLFLGNSSNKPIEEEEHALKKKQAAKSRPRFSKFSFQESFTNLDSNQKMESTSGLEFSERIGRSSPNRVGYENSGSDRYYFSTYSKPTNICKRDTEFSRRHSARLYYEEGLKHLRRESLRRNSQCASARSKNSRRNSHTLVSTSLNNGLKQSGIQYGCITNVAAASEKSKFTNPRHSIDESFNRPTLSPFFQSLGFGSSFKRRPTPPKTFFSSLKDRSRRLSGTQNHHSSAIQVQSLVQKLKLSKEILKSSKLIEKVVNIITPKQPQVSKSPNTRKIELGFAKLNLKKNLLQNSKKSDFLEKADEHVEPQFNKPKFS